MTVTGHVEKLAASMCKQKSGDRMWCGSCHDPHQLPKRGEAASWFDTHIIDGTVNFAGWLTRGDGWLSSMWDKIVIDGIAVNGPAYFAQALSYPVKLLQWGLVQWYALVMVVGLVGFVAYYTFR